MMSRDELKQIANDHLEKLCLELPDRRVGSFGNQMATEFFAEIIASFGFRTECPEFECIDWECGEVSLEISGQPFDVLISPYSLGCKVTAPIIAASTVEALELLDASEKILFLYGEIAKEQFMPKNFPFYNPEEHQRIYRLLEAQNPKAIIAATSRNPAESIPSP